MYQGHFDGPDQYSNQSGGNSSTTLRGGFQLPPGKKNLGEIRAPYPEDEILFKEFLREFEILPLPDGEEDVEYDENDDPVARRGASGDIGDKPYMNALKQIAYRKQKSLVIYLDDLHKWTKGRGKDTELCNRVMTNVMRYQELFANCVDVLLPIDKLAIDLNDPFDVMRYNRDRSKDYYFYGTKGGRLQSLKRGKTNRRPTAPSATDPLFAEAEPVADPMDQDNPPAPTEEEDPLPRELTRRFELNMFPLATAKIMRFRQVRSRQIGKLLRVPGMVTRATEVRPLLQFATYSCDKCGLEVYQQIMSRVFMPLMQCPALMCKQSSPPGKLNMQPRGSKLVKYQEIRLQELSEDVPVGNVPRSVTCQVFGELTRTCAPGDAVTLTGVFLPLTDDRWRPQGLQVTTTYCHVMGIEHHKKKTLPTKAEKDALQAKLIKFTTEEPDPYHRLARSIAPEIYGMEDVKKALLLQMVGGVTRIMKDGMKIRGDINICMMGDPGVAKSQLLKHISTIAPRAVYTSGKGSSGVGLTAAVMRDPITKEYVLEGGSLVLADMGICCIDEFDKMEDADRTAIHEVMEQQTISIAKAGISTTLNARAAILAAANPAWGRYNPKKSPSENINLPAALLSRFDLLFLLLDEPDLVRDRELATHISRVHLHGEMKRSDDIGSGGFLTSEFIRSYLGFAKTVEPTVPTELRDYIVSAYVGMRHQRTPAAGQRAQDGEFGFTTARTLLAILRLSQALARIRLSDTIEQADVEEAIRLMDKSKQTLNDSRQKKKFVDPVSAIYGLVRDMLTASAKKEIKYSEVLPIVLLKGFQEEQLTEVLQEYERLGIFMLSDNKELISSVM